MKYPLWFAAFLTLFFMGCATASENFSEHILLGPKPDFASMRTFQTLLNLEPGTPNYEKTRVEYLLERLGNSPYNFVRNDMEYTNRRAVMHLRWKYLRQHNQEMTAEQFIDRVAASSKMTGQSYLMEVDSKTYPLREILHNELDLLDERLASEKQALSRQPKLKPTP